MIWCLFIIGALLALIGLGRPQSDKEWVVNCCGQLVGLAAMLFAIVQHVGGSR